MFNLKRWLLILVPGGLVVIMLAGFLTVMPVLAQGPGGMMGGFGFNNQAGGYGPGWMMGYSQSYTGTTPYGFGPGWMHGGFGPGGMMGRGMMGRGMMGGLMGGFGPGWGYTQGETEAGAYGYGCPGGMGRGGMMWSSNSPFFAVEPLNLADATAAVNTFLTNLNDENLELAEVMIFDNHAYAEIVEKDSGIGAMELLVDPASKAVYPEMGPNMMWNLKYGMMAGYGRWGQAGSPAEIAAEMPISAAEAVEAAQSYLDANLGQNFTADEEAEPFYGYYTLHVNKDGQTIGMLSVNGYTGQVFLHTWHGKLLEMSGE
jgi:hypothetical protein